MADEKTKLAVIDGETLMDMKLPPTKFCVDTLLPQGLCILGGASKIGKSWWVLDLCVRIAKGEPMWELKTARGTTLYLCLEDTLRRVQNRLLCITDEVPPNAFFATSAGTLSELEQIPYQPQVYAIPIEQRKRESKLLADAVEFQPKLYQMIERLATAEELSDHCISIQNIEAEYMEKTVREVVTENRKTAAQMQSLIEQAGKNQEQFILNCSETLSKSTETLDGTIEKLHRKILKIMIAAAVSAVALSLLVCVVFWKLAV